MNSSLFVFLRSFLFCEDCRDSSSIFHAALPRTVSTAVSAHYVFFGRDYGDCGITCKDVRLILNWRLLNCVKKETLINWQCELYIYYVRGRTDVHIYMTIAHKKNARTSSKDCATHGATQEWQSESRKTRFFTMGNSRHKHTCQSNFRTWLTIFSLCLCVRFSPSLSLLLYVLCNLSGSCLPSVTCVEWARPVLTHFYMAG